MDFAAKLQKDIAEGLMLKMSLRDFKAKYGEHRAIAALAVIVEDEAIGKKRMIYDATHGVRVNHRYVAVDTLPRQDTGVGAREKKQLLREMMEARQVAFSVVGDIAKAHRRFKQWKNMATWGARYTPVLAIGGRGSQRLGYVRRTTC